MDQKKKILVVDDDSFILGLITKALKSGGYDYVLCENGLEATKILEKQHVNAIITDINMPHKDGLALSKDVIAAGKDIPILIISGEDFTSPDIKSDYMNTVCSYADEVLGKPFTKEELLEALHFMIQRKIDFKIPPLQQTKK